MSQYSCDAQEGICPLSNASYCLCPPEAADAAALVRLLPLAGSGCCLLSGRTGLSLCLSGTEGKWGAWQAEFRLVSCYRGECMP